MEENMKCPDCGSTLYHIKDLGNERYLIRCYKTKECGWQKKVKEE